MNLFRGFNTLWLSFYKILICTFLPYYFTGLVSYSLTHPVFPSYVTLYHVASIYPDLILLLPFVSRIIFVGRRESSVPRPQSGSEQSLALLPGVTIFIEKELASCFSPLIAGLARNKKQRNRNNFFTLNQLKL